MKDKFSKKELVGYIISGIIAMFGLVLVVLGIIERNMDVISSKNFLMQADQSVQTALNIKLSFWEWGLIFMALGVIIAVIILCVFAKKADREVDRKLRRQARANSAIDINSEVKAAVQIIEEPAQTPTEEAQPLEK